MIRISKATVSASGEVKEHDLLPMVFDDAAEADRFMDVYGAKIFADGRSGYDRSGGYWWGCDGTLEAILHRYVVDA